MSTHNQYHRRHARIRDIARDESRRPAAGRPLDAATRAFMEPRFGHSFANIRIHADASAAASARALGARAYTHGDSIVFGAGQYAPETTAGRELLAHELAHVVQAREAPAPAARAVSTPGDAAEVEAAQAGPRVAAGHAVTLGAAPATAISRAPESSSDDEEKQQAMFGGMGGTLDFAKSLLGIGGDESVLSGVPGMGVGLDALGDTLGRLGKGQSASEALGGGLTKGLTSGLLGMAGDALGGVEKNAGLSGGMGLLGGGMKFLGSLLGEEAGPDFGVGDIGELVGTAGTLLNPKALVEQGIQEGWSGLFNVSHAGMDYLVNGDEKALLDLGDRNLRGDNGSITQGYAMIAEGIGSLATGDMREMYRISDMAASGELGPLAKAGDWLGDTLYDIFN